MKKLWVALGCMVLLLFAGIHSLMKIANDNMNAIHSRSAIAINQLKDASNSDKTMGEAQLQGIEQVSLEDQQKAMALLDKLDIRYIIEMSQGGFTEEEKKKIKEHMKSRLSESEIHEVSKLYGRYGLKIN